MMGCLNIEHWLTNEEIKKIEYSDYWNDEENEKEKEWYVLDGDFSKMEGYIQEKGLVESLKECIDDLKIIFNLELRGTGIDLAAGNLWAVPHLFNAGQIDKLYCLEYSNHRLLKIGSSVLEHYHVPTDKLVLALGSFYDLHLKDDSMDFVFLFQAFHHADDPDKLLSEIHRVLKPGGFVIIIGEPIANFKTAYLRYFVKFLISISIPLKIQQRIFGKTFRVFNPFPRSNDLFPHDPVLGDHCHTEDEYLSMFSKYKFKIRQKKTGTKYQSFILVANNE